MLSHCGHVQLCASTDCSPPGSSVHEILQARTLERVTIPFSRGSSRLRDGSLASRIAGASLSYEPPGSPLQSLVDAASMLHSILVSIA